jgi:uncharacterized protein (TIGR02217 family)
VTLPVFPSLPGQGWSVKKTPRFSTRIAKHSSGREVRAPRFAQTLYDFELVFDGLASNGGYPALGRHTLQILMDFFVALQGSFGTFLYTDRADSRGTGVPLTPAGNGSLTTFNFQRALFDRFERVGYVSYVSAIYINGNAQSGNWTLANPTAAVPWPNLTFTSAPASGAVVSADFNWQFVCRSSEDTLEFEEFMEALWKQDGWPFQSVRNGGF